MPVKKYVIEDLDSNGFYIAWNQMHSRWEFSDPDTSTGFNGWGVQDAHQFNNRGECVTAINNYFRQNGPETPRAMLHIKSVYVKE